MDSETQPQIPLLSFIVVTWNAKEYTRQCLDSLATQVDRSNAEIIVVDNESSDGTFELVRDHYPDVKLIKSGGNLGFAKANNIGIAYSRGKYLFLVNSDVVLRDDCISNLCKFMEDHPEAGMVGPKILNSDLTLQDSCKEFPTLWNTFCRALALDSIFPNSKLFAGQLMRYWAHNDVRPVDILSGCFWVIRRRALEKVGLLDEQFFMYAEDKDWCKRFWDAGWSVLYFPGAEAIHFGGGSSSREPVRFALELNRANLRYWKKHYGTVRQLGFRLLLLLHYTVRIISTAIQYAVTPSQRESLLLKLDGSLACGRSILFIRNS
jgi:GT2 family glycosyltransferase